MYPHSLKSHHLHRAPTQSRTLKHTQFKITDIDMLLRTKQKLQAARAELGKLNEGIQAPEVAVLDAEGKRLGTMVWRSDGLYVTML